MKIKSWHMGLIVLIVIFGGIAMTMAFNIWNTEAVGAAMAVGVARAVGTAKFL